MVSYILYVFALRDWFFGSEGVELHKPFVFLYSRIASKVVEVKFASVAGGGGVIDFRIGEVEIGGVRIESSVL